MSIPKTLPDTVPHLKMGMDFFSAAFFDVIHLPWKWWINWRDGDIVIALCQLTGEMNGALMGNLSDNHHTHMQGLLVLTDAQWEREGEKEMVVVAGENMPKQSYFFSLSFSFFLFCVCWACCAGKLAKPQMCFVSMSQSATLLYQGQ